MILLGIESSCDDTSVAVSRGVDILANVTYSQTEHAAFGGIVPEVASRAHDRKITATVDAALRRAGLTLEDVDAIAVTQGPGLVGSLLVGLTFAKGLSLANGIPLVGVDHIDAHLYASWIGREVSYPFLGLIVSGGHTQLVAVKAPLRHRVLGATRDDAAGEAFDKTGKMLGLAYPAGPLIDRLSQQGDPARYTFPQSLRGEGLEFSFSGLKTSVRYFLDQSSFTPEELETERPHLCAGISEAITQVLIDKLRLAIEQTGMRHVTIAGGVSANSMLRRKAKQMAEQEGVELDLPPMDYCTDNAAMICRLGLIRLQMEGPSALSIAPYSRQQVF